MTDSALVVFKQVIHWNLNLAVLVLLAWLLLGKGKAARTTLAIWSILLIRALSEPWLCPERSIPPPLDFGEQGMLAVGLGMGWGEKTISVLLGLGTEEISVGDLAVFSLGHNWSVALGFFFISLVSLSSSARLITLWKARGTRSKLTGAEAQVIISAQATSPHVSGWWRPSIVVPEELVDTLTAEELRAVVCHERAHIRRGDHWLFAFMYLVRALVVVIWPLGIVLNSLEQAIERLCDRAAAEEVGVLETARALVKAAEYQVAQNTTSLVPEFRHAHFSRHPITERLAALRRINKDRESLLAMILAVFFLAAVIL